MQATAPPLDTLTTLQQAVTSASAKMDAAVGYGPWRLAQADYNEAREVLHAFRYGPIPADAQPRREAARRAAGIERNPIAF